MYVIFTYITFHCVTVYFLIKYIITRASQFPGGLLLTIERQIKFLTVNFKIQRKWSRKSCNFIKQKKKHSLFHQARQQFSSWHIKNNSGWRHWCLGPKHFSKSAECANGYRPHLARLPELVIGCSKQNKNRSRQRHYYQLGLVKKTWYLFARCSKQLWQLLDWKVLVVTSPDGCSPAHISRHVTLKKIENYYVWLKKQNKDWGCLELDLKFPRDSSWDAPIIQPKISPPVGRYCRVNMFLKKSRAANCITFGEIFFFCD